MGGGARQREGREEEKERREERKNGGPASSSSSFSLHISSLSLVHFSPSVSHRGNSRWPVLCHVKPPEGPPCWIPERLFCSGKPQKTNPDDAEVAFEQNRTDFASKVRQR